MSDEPITEASLLAQLEQARRERDEWKRRSDTYRARALAMRKQTLKRVAGAIETASWFDDQMSMLQAYTIRKLRVEIKDLKDQVAERSAALCQSCPLLAGSAELLKTINELRLRRIEAEANDELHKRAAVTLGKWYLSAQTRQALDDLRTCEFEEGGS